MAVPSTFPFGSATALVRALRAGRVSSQELLQAYLDRVDCFNPALNAIIADDPAALIAYLKQRKLR